MIQHIFKKGLSQGRFHGEMYCPFCSIHVDPTTTPIGFESDKPRLKQGDDLGPFMREYICKDCGGRFRYDIRQQFLHPYNSFKRGLKHIDLPLMKYTGKVPLLNK